MIILDTNPDPSTVIMDERTVMIWLERPLRRARYPLPSDRQGLLVEATNQTLLVLKSARGRKSKTITVGLSINWQYKHIIPNRSNIYTLP